MSFKQVILAKLDAMGRKYTISGNEIKTLCLNPEHNDSNPSYFINTVTGVSHCFSCGYSPHPAQIIDCSEADTEELLRQAKYNTLLSSMKQVTEDKEVTEFTLPPKAYDIDRDWRGISQDLLSKLGVYYCDTGRYAGRLIFPIYDLDNNLLGLDARIVNPAIVPEYVSDVKWLRAKGMRTQDIVYPLDIITKMDTSHIVVTEGLMDAISFIALGVPAIPSFGLSSPSSDKIATLISIGCTTITLALDNDERGQAAVKRLYKDYIKWFKIQSHPLASKIYRASLINSSIKDANDYLLQKALHE